MAGRRWCWQRGGPAARGKSSCSRARSDKMLRGGGEQRRGEALEGAARLDGGASPVAGGEAAATPARRGSARGAYAGGGRRKRAQGTRDGAPGEARPRRRQRCWGKKAMAWARASEEERRRWKLTGRRRVHGSGLDGGRGRRAAWRRAVEDDGAVARTEERGVRAVVTPARGLLRRGPGRRGRGEAAPGGVGGPGGVRGRRRGEEESGRGGAGTWRGETDASVPHFICKRNFSMRMKIIYTKNIFEDSYRIRHSVTVPLSQLLSYVSPFARP